MDKKINAASTLYELVDLDTEGHVQRDIATLFLNAMNNWPSSSQNEIPIFAEELKEYFGEPLTAEKIRAKEFNGKNAWQIEAGNHIAELIELSSNVCNQPDLDKIIEGSQNYYRATENWIIL